MKSNTEKAVLLIAGLSLLLGLSIGKIQQQYQHIQTLKSQVILSPLKVQVTNEFPSSRTHPLFNCQMQAHTFYKPNCNRREQLRSMSHLFIDSKTYDRTLLDLQELNKEMILLEKELKDLEQIHPTIQISINK